MKTMCCSVGDSCTDRWRGSYKVVSIWWTAINAPNPREGSAAVLASRAIQVKCYPCNIQIPYTYFIWSVPFLSLTFYGRSTGFILEGFPQHSEEVSFLVERQLYPDTALVMSVEVSEVVKRLLPPWLDRWRERCTRRRGQMQLLKELRSKIRVGMRRLITVL